MEAKAEQRTRLRGYAQQVLDAQGRLPLPQEAAREVGVSVRTAYRQLDRLAEEKGLDPPRILRRLTQSERDAIVRFVIEGGTVALAALEFEVGQNTVRRALRDAEVVLPASPGAPKARGKDQPSPSTRETIRAFIRSRPDAADLSHRQIANALGLKPSTVSYHLPRIQQEVDQDDGTAEGVAAPPRGERFISNCHLLAEGVAQGGVPMDQRRLVLSLCLPVLRPDKHISSPYLILAVPSAVSYHYLRHGTPATVEDIADLMPQHSVRAVRAAAQKCRFMQTLDAAGEGYVPVSPDPMYAPALTLSRSDVKGWGVSLLRARSAVLDIVLHGSALASS